MCLKASPIPIERSDLLLCALHVLYFSLSSLNFRLIPCLSSQTATGPMSIPTSLTISLPYSLRLPWTLFMALCKFLTNLSNPTSARTKSFQYWGNCCQCSWISLVLRRSVLVTRTREESDTDRSSACTAHASTCDICLPSMCFDIVHGQRSTSSSCQGGNELHSTRLVRGVPSFT